MKQNSKVFKAVKLWHCEKPNLPLWKAFVFRWITENWSSSGCQNIWSTRTTFIIQFWTDACL